MHGVRARRPAQNQAEAMPGETSSSPNQRRPHLPRVHTGGVAISSWVQQTHTCVCLGAKRAPREKSPFTGLLPLLSDIFNEWGFLFWASETSTSPIGFWTTEQTLICSVDQAVLATTAVHHTVLTLPKGTQHTRSGREGLPAVCHFFFLRKKEIKLTKSEKCEKLTSWTGRNKF